MLTACKFNERHANQTLLLQSTETVVPSLNRLRCALEADLAASVGINVYWSPPNSVGFKLHHDGHDIIVVQTAGKKCWFVCEKKKNQKLYLQNQTITISTRTK